MNKASIQIDKIESNLFAGKCEVHMLRCDLFLPEIPGNKYWKMKYNISEMQTLGLNHLVTFGGAYSNHIAAVAQTGKKYNFKTTGIIRGEEASLSNHTLSLAKKNGMEFRFIDRQKYREWKKGEVDLDDFLGINDYYLLPEGGSNALAVKGCVEIMNGIEGEYDIITCPVGTGATLAGIITASSENQQVLGFSNMKGGEYIAEEIILLMKKYHMISANSNPIKKNWKLIHDYHFGGFAKVTKELIDFYLDFKNDTGIELDLIYTAKMMYGLKEMIVHGDIHSASKILAIHTGGQQGNVSLLESGNVK